MVTRLDYGRDEVEKCLSVMVELMTLLGKFRDHIVLVGGWVPYFLYKEKRQEHTGSLDIDIALDFKNISNEAYQTILQLLRESDYEQGEQPYIFYRHVKMENGIQMAVKIDFLSGEYGGTGKSHRTQKVQDIRARKTRGCDLVFQKNFSFELSGKMPDSAVNEVIIKISDAVPFLVMKGMALQDRLKEKDAYDIYFTILHYPGGLQKLAEEFDPFKSQKLVREGLGKIRTKFIDINSPGPVWVVNFENIDDEEEKDRVKRDVFERVNAFLDVLDIEPFREE